VRVCPNEGVDRVRAGVSERARPDPPPLYADGRAVGIDFFFFAIFFFAALNQNLADASILKIYTVLTRMMKLAI
jgi:hypothetical protein